MRVDEVMSEDPAYVDDWATAGEAIRKLVERHVHHLPVLHDGILVGILSDRDLRNVGPRVDEPVTAVMSTPVVSFTPDADLKDVADAMIEHHISAVPVVDPESEKLVGIVSYVDVLRVAREALWC